VAGARGVVRRITTGGREAARARGAAGEQEVSDDGSSLWRKARGGMAWRRRAESLGGIKSSPAVRLNFLLTMSPWMDKD
jgi:hypothetical protein